MRKLTVIIPTFNEEDNLRELLPLVQWADEVIVVDSFSTDQSVAVAKEFNSRVLTREYINSASQKNWTIPQAENEWILLIDADERPQPALIQEVQTMLAQDIIEHDAYWISRDNHFLGKRIKYSGWQNDKVIRFFRKSTCKYEEKHVHAELLSTGTIGSLKGRFSHFTYKDLGHFSRKMEKYADWSANDYVERTPKVTLYHLMVKPIFRFWKHYVAKGGFRDGVCGFIVSSYMAWGVFLRYAKIKEKHLKST